MLDLERLRDDFRTVAADRKACGYWTEADEQEAGLMIKADLGGSDEGLKLCWAFWLATEAEEIRRWKSRVRDVEARIHTEAEQARRQAA